MQQRHVLSFLLPKRFFCVLLRRNPSFLNPISALSRFSSYFGGGPDYISDTPSSSRHHNLDYPSRIPPSSPTTATTYASSVTDLSYRPYLSYRSHSSSLDLPSMRHLTARDIIHGGSGSSSNNNG